MRGVLIVSTALFLSVVAGCATEEPRIVSTSLGTQFESLSKEGWQVSGTDQPAGRGGRRSNDPLSDPNVRVIRGGDFSNLQFHTNFQTNDPRAGQPATQPSGAPTGPAMPWGMTPKAVPGGR